MKMMPLISTLYFAVGAVLLPGMLCSAAHGAAGHLAPSFDPGSGLNGPVRAIALQPDGKMIIGGGFISMVKGHGCQNIGDDSFAYAGPLTGVGTVHAVALQPDGMVVIGGEFGTVRGLRRVGLARLRSDGSGDPTFDPGDVGVGQYLLAVALQPDGKVLVGGPTGIFRLNPDGSRDLDFREPPLEAISVFGFPSLGRPTAGCSSPATSRRSMASCVPGSHGFTAGHSRLRSPSSDRARSWC